MRLLPLIVAVALPYPLLAETYTVTSAPSAVTVYSGFAMVTRKVSVAVGAGPHEVILADLPPGLDADNLRIALDGATLGSTRLRTDAVPPQPDRDSAAVTAAKARIEAAERALRDLNDAVEDARLAGKAAEARIAFLSGLASSATLPSEPDAIASVAQMIETQTLAATRTQTEAERRARQIADGREMLEDELADARAALAALTPPADPSALLAVSVNAAQAGTLTVSISYPADASWQPTYDVMLDRGTDAALTLRRGALVYQNTAENWDNVALTLSTLSPSGQVVPSEIYPPLYQYGDPLPTLQKRSASDLSVTSEMAPSSMMIGADIARPDFDGPGVSYTLSGPISVARGAEGVRVALDTLDFAARVFARAVPTSDTTAFLMAEAVNDTKEPLLAALNAQIFLDGALVGRTRFEVIPAGGKITQAFGPIEDLRLSEVILDRSEGDRGLISRNNAQTQARRLEVENLGTKAWDVEMWSAIPYSEQDNLTIDWVADPRPDGVDVDDRRGLLQWNFDIGAGQTQSVRIEQDVRWPDGKVLR